MLAIGDLLQPLTTDEIKASLLSLASSLGLRVNTWKSGGTSRTLVATFAAHDAITQQVMVEGVKGGFRETAASSWLTALARNTYNVERIDATFATGVVTLTNASGDTYNIAPGDLVFQNSTTGKTYRNQTGGTLNASSTLDVDVLADEAGTDSSSSATDIDTLVTTLIGVTVSNAADVVGTDAETDDELRARCLESLGALSPNGSRLAYDFVAKTTLRADGVTPVAINRTKTTGTNGAVTCTIAAPGGAPIAGDVTLVDTAIQEKVVPIGITATVQGATANTIAITYTAFVSTLASESDQEIQDAVQASLEAYFASLPIGGLTKGAGYFVFHDLLRARISDASSAIFSVTLGTPAADVAITSAQVPVLGAVTPTITRVSQ